MKTLYIITLSFFLLISCNQHQGNKLPAPKSPDTNYYSKTSEWGQFQKYISNEIRNNINKNILDTSYVFVAQMYESKENQSPAIDKLITISFNKNDNLMYYSYQTSIIKTNNKNIQPLKQERIFWSNEFFCPIDTVNSRINLCDFWNQPSEIKVDGKNDGKYMCVIIRNKSKLHYVLRWSPDVVNESLYPKRKEFMKLCDMFKNFGKIWFFDNHWNWYGQQEEI